MPATLHLLPRALLFDLFDTVVHFDPARLPEVVVDGRRERTASLYAYQALSRRFPAGPFEGFYRLFLEHSRALWEERDRTHREFSSTHRFRTLLPKLGVELGEGEREGVVREMVEAHMGGMAAATLCRPEVRATLGRLREAFGGFGLVSNFDHGPAAREILGRHGLGDFFSAVVVSEEVGLRKPLPELFLQAARALRVKPAEALFVGDTYAADVLGPKGAGMPCVWVNPRGEAVPPGGVEPDGEIRSLPELLPLLGLEPLGEGGRGYA